MNQLLIKIPNTDLLVGEDRWADKVPQSIFNHVLHQMCPKHFLVVNQECCLDSGYNSLAQIPSNLQSLHLSDSPEGAI